MISAAAAVALAIWCALLSRTPEPGKVSPRRGAARTGLVALGLMMVGWNIYALLQRGFDSHAWPLIGSAIGWITVAVKLMANLAGTHFERGPDGIRLNVSISYRRDQPWLLTKQVLWCLVGIILLASPLRYAGILSNYKLDVAVAEALTRGHFDPISEVRTLAVGQCLTSRRPQRDNRVTSCTRLHQSQIVDRELDPAKCPTISDFDTADLPLLEVKSVVVDDAYLCYLRAVDEPDGWEGRVRPGRELAYTP